MTTEQDVEKLEGLVGHIESYVGKGDWDADEHESILAAIIQADAVYNQIISSYVESPGIPPASQAFQVSDLQERLHRAKHHLPLPPVKPTERTDIGSNKVLIYTAPT